MSTERVKWIMHKNRKILFLDYSGLLPEQLEPVVDEALKAHKTEQFGTISCCVYAENLHFNTSVVNKFNALVNETKPYMKATAVVGVKGLIKIMYDAVAKFTNAEMKTFDKKEDALDWLAGK